MKKHIKVICSCDDNKQVTMRTFVDESIIHTILSLNDSPIIERHGEWGAAVLKKLGDDNVNLGPILAKIMSKLTFIEGIVGLNSWSFTIEEDVDIVDNSRLSFEYRVDGNTARLTIFARGVSKCFRLHRDENGKWVFSGDFMMFIELEKLAVSVNLKESLIMNCLVESLNDFNDKQISPYFFIHKLDK